MNRIVTRLKAMTWPKRLTLAWFAGFPFVVAFVVLVPVGRVAAIVILLTYWLAFGAMGFAVLLVRRARFVAPPTELEFVEPDRTDLYTGMLAPERPEWASRNSDFLEEHRLAGNLAAIHGDNCFAIGARTRSDWMREPLAFRISEGRFSYAQLADLFEGVGWHPSDAKVVKADLQPRQLFVLGRLLSTQATHPRDRRVAANIFRYLAGRPQFAQERLDTRLYVAERIMLAGDLEQSRPVVAALTGAGLPGALLHADLMNPFAAHEDTRHTSAWLGVFNSIYTAHGFEPVTLLPEGITPYDRLSTAPLPPVNGGPKVSIIMSCFEPDHALFTAVRSVIDQTWQNWELLVVDDASGPAFDETLDAVAAMDPRIRVIRATVNAGTYVRRNEAMDLSTGEIITMHDSDDWAHPRRLELEVNYLVAHPEEPAVIAQSVRVSEHLSFVQPRRAVLRLSEPSLMFRKKEVMAAIGYFDSVRKGADTEYRQRLEAVTGRPVPVIPTEAPLFLMRFLTTSLSGEEFRDGWMHPGRAAYRAARVGWHARIAAGEADARVPFPMEARPFHAPIKYRPVRAEPPHFDIIVLFDGRHEFEEPYSVAEFSRELRALAKQGLKVGYVHVESLARGRSQTRYGADLPGLINGGIVEQLMLDDVASADLIVVRAASALQTPPSVPSTLTADRVVVLREPNVDIVDHTYARKVVLDEARRLFGVEPEWVTAPSPMDYSRLKVEPVLRE